MGRVVRVKLKRGKVPELVRLCLTPGKKKPQACR